MLIIITVSLPCAGPQIRWWPDTDNVINNRNAITRSLGVYSTVQYSTVQYSTVQYSTVQRRGEVSTVQYSTDTIMKAATSAFTFRTLLWKQLLVLSNLRHYYESG